MSRDIEAQVFDGLRRDSSATDRIILADIGSPTAVGFRASSALWLRYFDDFEYFSVGSIGVSGTYRIGPPDFYSGDEFLIVPKEKMQAIRL